jgi:NAD(P)-dependent dehydrogenase (short-subunit alcohol dehydrogenase family)
MLDGFSASLIFEETFCCSSMIGRKSGRNHRFTRFIRSFLIATPLTSEDYEGTRVHEIEGSGWQAGGFPTKLEGRVALVTGAASGIARAAAQRFAREGAYVVAADSSAPGGLETVKLIQADGGLASFIQVDVSQADQVNRMVETIFSQHGRLDVLFNGAAILFYGTAVETAEEAWNRMLAINLTGTFLCCRAVLPHMIERGRGSIINIASTTGAHDACARAVAYVTSKGGVHMMSRAMAIDHAKQGIRVNVICPGPTDTPMLRNAMTAEQLDAFTRTFPMGRLGLPEEIAGAALFLASDDASFMTGSVLYVDGGQTAEV